LDIDEATIYAMNSSKTGSVQMRENSTAMKQSEWDEGPTKVKQNSEVMAHPNLFFVGVSNRVLMWLAVSQKLGQASNFQPKRRSSNWGNFRKLILFSSSLGLLSMR
jgi:hypothetical protein